jgi:hypothetical protein
MIKTNRILAPHKLTFVAVSLFMTISVFLRFTLRSSKTLWEDEIIAATHAVQPAWRVILDSIINDMHPPLYFLELHFWGFFKQSDHWLILNSVFFSLAAIASLFIVMRRLRDTEQAITIGAVFSVLPVCLWMAQEVRMYSFLSVLLIWMYYFSYQSFVSRTAQSRPYFLTGIFAVAIVYTHAIGFITILIFGLYCGLSLVQRRSSKSEFLWWLIVFASVGFLSLPLLISDLIRQADMPEIQGFHDVLDWMSSVVIGAGFRHAEWLRNTGLLIYVIVISLGIFLKKTRWLTCCFLVFPIALCLVTGLVARPLFKADFFSNFYSPFLAIIIGSLIHELPARHYFRPIIIILALAIFLFLAVSNRQAINPGEAYFGDVAALLKSDLKPGDVIWAPQGGVFWGVNRYMVGPRWGSPVTIAAPLRSQSGWYKIFDALGPEIVEKFALMPTTQSVLMADGTPIFVGAYSVPDISLARRVWLITYAPRNDIPPTLPGSHIGAFERIESNDFSPLQVNLYQRL